MGTVIVNAKQIDQFKAKWPCHGLPDELATIWFVFDSQGDLVDIYAHDEHGRDMDAANFDGPALSALADDASKQNRRWKPSWTAYYSDHDNEHDEFPSDFEA